MLCDDKFVGRIELETDKKGKVLLVKKFWSEDKICVFEYRENIISGINRFAKYNLCDNIEIGGI